MKTLSRNVCNLLRYKNLELIIILSSGQRNNICSLRLQNIPKKYVFHVLKLTGVTIIFFIFEFDYPSTFSKQFRDRMTCPFVTCIYVNYA